MDTATRTAQDPDEAVFAAAQNLAEAIRRDPRWVEWSEATEAADSDGELMALMEQYKDLFARTRSGQGDPRALGELVRLIQRHPTYERHEKATEAMVGLLREADMALSQGLGLEFAATAAPQKTGGGCCG